MNEVWYKTGNELIDDETIKARLRSIRSIHYRNILNEPLKKYGLDEWLTCVNEGLFVDYAVSMLSKVVAALSGEQAREFEQTVCEKLHEFTES